MRRKGLFALAAIVVLIIANLFPVMMLFSGPESAPYFEFETQNLPEGTAFVDLLIHLPEEDPMYVPGNPGKLPAVFSGNDQILRYCEDDYRSYTFHYRDALSRILLTKEGKVNFFTDSADYFDASRIRYDHKEDILSRGKIRLAMMDSKGNILQISRPHSLKTKGLFSVTLGYYVYDGQKDVLLVEDFSMLSEFWQMVMLTLLGLAQTCFLEELVAWMFGFGKSNRRVVRWTNLVSKPLMRTLQWNVTALPMGRDNILPYVAVVICLEILAYLCEYMCYREKLNDISPKRCLLYAVCANAVSALGSMFFFL